MIKSILTKKKCKKAKWLSEEALQIGGNKKAAEGKGEKERYTRLKHVSGRKHTATLTSVL